ncbi:MAG: (d)CMP kinase [Coriobacteriaceae bacterium]|nr:(d)CMP kinase [Coriobacteriaceae bacterium]
MIIALDGPSGAGKSTIAKSIARKLGMSCLDTGAMYRSIAWWALEHGIDLDDADALGAVARQKDISFEVEPGDPSPKKVLIDGIDVTSQIRTGEIDRSVSIVSSHVPVREALVEQQRRIGNAGDYVVEGRDIGTTVFPNAAVKVFMTASAEERARRRVRQNEKHGVGNVDYEQVLADIMRRDELDSSRDTSPLRPADDAVILDTSDLSIDEVVERICSLVQR